jgi:hypothetical protein
MRVSNNCVSSEDKTAGNGRFGEAGTWFARQFIGIWKFVARPNLCVPIFIKPPLRYRQPEDNVQCKTRVKIK